MTSLTLKTSSRMGKLLPTTAVSYLNTKPFLYGLAKTGMLDRLDLSLNIPSECARKLLAGEVTLGLVPVAVLPEVPQAQVISDYCIGTEGTVKTVCLYSDVPLERVSHLYLDHHSRTSAALVRVLLREYWQLDPELLPARDGYIDQLGGTTAGLVIGDRCMGLSERFAYEYDLGEAWEAHTGLPFVFAVWVSTEPLTQRFLSRFNSALATGLAAIPELLYILPAPAADFSLATYFNEYISYALDAPKKRALKLFLRKLNTGVPSATRLQGA